MLHPASLATRLVARTSKSAAKASKSRNVHSYSAAGKRVVTLIPGDGIGPEITSSVVGIIQAAGVPVQFERFDLDPQAPFPESLLMSIARNGVVLKGPLFTQHSTGPKSRNMALRKMFDQQVEVIPCKTLPNVPTRHGALDVVIIRENVEGEYSGLEQEVVPGVVQSMKITTSRESEHVARFAFDFAKNNGRKKVTAIHKANIMKMTDGLFLESVRKVAKDYPSIVLQEMIIDNTSMQLVQKPSQFDVMVTPNLYGNIVTNIATGLIGGPGVIPGANYGPHVAFFEPGARHAGMDIAGKGVANPTALILSSCMMLRHLDLKQHADQIEAAVWRVYQDGKIRTRDLKGPHTTAEFTQAVIDALKH